jgi:endonuclease YncB( thermonuclease family)
VLGWLKVIAAIVLACGVAFLATVLLLRPPLPVSNRAESRSDSQLSQPGPSAPPTVVDRTIVISGRAIVIDADTLEINSIRIRLWGIDAPENDQTCQGSDSRTYRCGEAATKALTQKLSNILVECRKRDRDRYGRIVATCFTANEDIAEWLVMNGWALDWPRFSNGAYAKAEEFARIGTRGIWVGSFVKPWEWRPSRR